MEHPDIIGMLLKIEIQYPHNMNKAVQAILQILIKSRLENLKHNWWISLLTKDNNFNAEARAFKWVFIFLVM